MYMACFVSSDEEASLGEYFGGGDFFTAVGDLLEGLFGG